VPLTAKPAPWYYADRCSACQVKEKVKHLHYDCSRKCELEGVTTFRLTTVAEAGQAGRFIRWTMRVDDLEQRLLDRATLKRR
jgi:hypothetical protein